MTCAASGRRRSSACPRSARTAACGTGATCRRAASARRRTHAPGRARRRPSVPQPVRAAGLHHGQRLLQEGQPERQHDRPPGQQRGWAAGDQPRPRHGLGGLPELPHPAGRGQDQRRRPTSAPPSTRRPDRWRRGHLATATAARDAARHDVRAATTTTRASRSPRRPVTAATGRLVPGRLGLRHRGRRHLARGRRRTPAAGPRRPGAGPARAAPRSTRRSRRASDGTGCSKRADGRRLGGGRPATPASRSTTRRRTRACPAGWSSAAPAPRRRSSPSVYALSGRNHGLPQQLPYPHASALFDVTSGSNGSCSPAAWCHAGAGWDGPTGLGTPNGTGAF